MSKSQTMIKLAAIAALLALGACSSGVKLDDTTKNGTGGAAGTGSGEAYGLDRGVGRKGLADAAARAVNEGEDAGVKAEVGDGPA